MPVKTPGQIHKWTCHKLESFSDFIDSYSPATRKADYCYLELFTGLNINPCNGVDCSLEDTVSRVLKSQVKFVRYAFLARNRSIAQNLKNLIPGDNSARNVEILTGNPNHEKSLRRLLDNVPRSASSLVFIDPEGYRRLQWPVLENLAAHGKTGREIKWTC